MNARNAIISGTVAVIVAGCNGGSGTSSGGGFDPYKSRDVVYTLECNKGVTCPNASDVSVYNSGDYHSVDCTWFCGNYKNQKNIYVSLDFIKSGSSCWSLEREYVSQGICN